MAYATPPTAVTGTVWTAANMNVYRDDIIQLSTGLLIPSHRSGEYYGSQLEASTQTSPVSANQLYGNPIVVPATATYDRIACYTSSGAAGNVRQGIYQDNGGIPGALVLDAGAMAVGATSNVITISQSLSGPAKYWLACVFSAGPTMYLWNGSAFIGSANPWAGFSPVTGAQRAFTYAALPDPFTPTAGGAAATPVMSLRAA